MNARTIMLTVLGGGPLLGLLFGVAIDPTMKPAPEPYWRQLRAIDVPSHASSRSLADAGAQDLSPRWDEDRMPTWKRRALDRATAAAKNISIGDAAHEPEAEPVFDAPAEAVEQPKDAAGQETPPNQAAARSARDTAIALAPPEPITPAREPEPAVIPVTVGL